MFIDITNNILSRSFFLPFSASVASVSAVFFPSFLYNEGSGGGGDRGGWESGGGV